MIFPLRSWSSIGLALVAPLGAAISAPAADASVGGRTGGRRMPNPSRITMKDQIRLCVVLVSALGLLGSNAEAQTVFTDKATFENAIPDLTTIDFDTDPGGSPIPNDTFMDTQYLSFGIDFDPANGGTPRTTTQSACPGTSTPNKMKTVTASLGGGGFSAVLSPPAKGVGMTICDLQDLDPSSLEIFDSGGSSIAVYTLQDVIGVNPAGLLFFGVASAVPIGRVEVRIGSNDFVAFDDLLITTPPPVPTMTSFYLIALALLMAATGYTIIRRRRTLF